MNTTKNMKNEELIKSDKKEILNNLLKQLIDQRLTRLEKRNLTESSRLQAISNETQNLILNLENMTNGVRKQIAIQRQEYINNNTKSTKSNSKSKIPKIIPKSLSTKKLNRTIESKSRERYNALQTDIYSKNNKSQIIGNKSKSKKKILTKRDDSGRKTVDLSNKAGLIPHSRVSRKTISPFSSAKETDKLNKTMGNKPSSRAKIKASSQKKNYLSKTEKVQKKNAPKF